MIIVAHLKTASLVTPQATIWERNLYQSIICQSKGQFIIGQMSES